MEKMDKPLTKNIRPIVPLLRLPITRVLRLSRAAQSHHPIAPKEVQQWVKDAGLRGRGGADLAPGSNGVWFPWMLIHPKPRYLVVNADEMEPGHSRIDCCWSKTRISYSRE